MNALEVILEHERQTFTGDDHYFRKMLCWFELRIPSVSGMSASPAFYFPLIVPPESYSMSEPFAAEETLTQGAGLWIEENGIVKRTIKISGTTGFKLRIFPTGTNGPAALGMRKSEKRSFGRSLKYNIAGGGHALSGHRHFQYLQDAVFRTYGDFKQDPLTAADTLLIFHNAKDDEHWVVAPKSFALDLTKADRGVLYHYTIELLVLRPATASQPPDTDDRSILDKMRDPARMLQSGLDLVSGSIQDLTALEADLTSRVKDYAVVIGNVTTIMNATADFLSGAESLVRLPAAFVEATIDLAENGIADVLAAESSLVIANPIPANVVQRWRSMQDGLERMLVNPAVFVEPSRAQLQATRALQDLDAVRGDAVPTATTPTSFTEAALLGTAVTAGEAQSARAELGAGKGVQLYTGAFEVVVLQGDSLVSLAARYLGDARLWQHIAVLNSLSPPFLTTQASQTLSGEDSPFSGAIGVGDKILIPSFARAAGDTPLLQVLGVRAEQDVAAQVLGTDIALEAVGGRPGAVLYDIAMDESGGSTDVRLVRGVDCVVQGFRIRVETEQGTDLLYPRLGLGPVIGSSFALSDLEAARARVMESLLADPRAVAVRQLDFSHSEADSLVIEAEVELRGFTEVTRAQLRV